MNIVLEQVSPLVVFAAPAPEVGAAAANLAPVQDACADHPHDNTEQEPTHSEHGIVDCDLLGSTVAPAAVRQYDNDREQEGYAGDAEDDNLRPDLLLGRPCRQVVSRWDGLGGVENGQDRAEHRKDDE